MKYYLSEPCPTVSDLEKKYVLEAIESNRVATGKFNALFEQSVRELTGTQNALAVVNGTSALHLALSVLGVNAGDVVFSSTFTFIGSVSPIIYVGAEPVFIDSDQATWNMDPNLLEDELKKRSKSGEKMPKALILTHIYGQPADMESICLLCDKYGIALIEDAAESLGATFDGKHTGTFGRMGVFSFNANKIVTSGGGGMLVSDDSSLIDKARFLANQAKDKSDHFEHSQIGYNYRMSNIQCAYGYAQLQEIAERVDGRRRVFEAYKRMVNQPPVTLMPEHEKARGTRWLTAMCFEDEDRVGIKQYMDAESIETRPLWKPMHMQPVFKDAKALVNGTSEKFFNYGLCFPSGHNLSDADVEEINKRIIRIL